MVGAPQQWRERERSLLEHADKEATRLAALADRKLGVIVLLACSVLTPVAVVLSLQELAAVGVGPGAVGALAVILAVLLVFSEMMGRNLRFRSRSASAMEALAALERDREIYLNNQVSLDVGSEDWVKNLFEFRATVEVATGSKVTEFY